MEIPPIKKEESLAMWRERLAKEFNLSDQVKEILDAVSIESFIHGTKAIILAMNNEARL